jgi:hypothetical protein
MTPASNEVAQLEGMTLNWHEEAAYLGNAQTPVNGRQLKIDIVFEEFASAREGEVLIRHVVSDCERETRLFKFEEFHSTKPRVLGARRASDSDLMLLGLLNSR